jgi:cytochrome c oxidase subunit II
MLKNSALRLIAGSISAALAVVGSQAAMAGTGQPTPNQMGLQGSVTQVMDDIVSFHDAVTIVLFAITFFVGGLMAYAMWRFSAKNNPTPSKNTHNTFLEVAWTVVPILILLGIAIPSFKLLYLQYSYPKPDITIKAYGNAWFWEHEYPDNGGFKVTSNMITDEDVITAEIGKAAFAARFAKFDGLERHKQLQDAAGPLWEKTKQVRQLTVDNEIAVPVNKVVHLLVTANDVIHSWTIPSFGSKVQAVPGRITTTWFKPTKVGVYYGQCSVLCGKQHSGMPIAVRVVPEPAFNEWLAAAKAKDWKKAKGILIAATEGPDAAKFAAAAPAR